MNPENPLYDLSQLQEISGGDDTFIKEILSLFVQSIPGSLQQINTSFKAGDLETVGKEAHKIKPSIDSLGILELYAVIRVIEREAKAGDPQNILQENIDNLNRVLQQVVGQITINEL
jgi:HPt (histidine-containing phosphotransfer) domain-containing protein